MSIERRRRIGVALNKLLRVLFARDRDQLLWRLGWRNRSIGERSMSSSASNHLKNCCRPLCLFSAVDGDRVSIIHA